MACDRKRSWRQLATSGEVHDRFTGQTRRVRSDQLTPLVDLSIVNELDVIAQMPSLLDMHQAYFRELFAVWAPVTSSAVRSEAGRVLGR
ncbi:hypothetical protein EAD89_11670 [Micromonospora sp. BL4]|nr:hypothetical protein EAD89_11670 [Micromonospora sp. BL4]